MNVTLRLLDLATERELFIEAYRWRDTAPRWFKACLDIWKESLDEYLENAAKELHYGVWNNDEFTASIRLIQDKPGVLNIHLAAKKGTELEVLYTAGCSLRDFVFTEGVQAAYGYLPTLNKGISLLYESLGFQDTGIRVFKGQVRGKVVEWKHYLITAPTTIQ